MTLAEWTQKLEELTERMKALQGEIQSEMAMLDQRVYRQRLEASGLSAEYNALMAQKPGANQKHYTQQ